MCGEEVEDKQVLVLLAHWSSHCMTNLEPACLLHRDTATNLKTLKGEGQLSVMSRFKNQEKKMAKSCKSSIFTAISITR